MRFDGDGSKWSDAKKALKRVLKESVPAGTKLSIWTFSQLPPEGIPSSSWTGYRGCQL